MPKNHILVIDDDTRLRGLLQKYLSNNDFDVSEAANATEALDLIQLFAFDLLVMDVMMPGQDGYTLTKQLRADGYDTPILMLTAMGDIDNRITGLENGADDYLTKPFEPKELLLRIHSILRRAQSIAKTESVCFGPYTYKITGGILLKEEEPVSLTTAEQELLRALAQKPNQVLSREELADLLKTDNIRTIDVQITRLRKKIEADIKNPLYIQTVRGARLFLGNLNDTTFVRFEIGTSFVGLGKTRIKIPAGLYFSQKFVISFCFNHFAALADFTNRDDYLFLCTALGHGQPPSRFGYCRRNPYVDSNH